MDIPQDKLNHLEQTIQATMQELEERRVADKRKSRIIALFVSLGIFTLIWVNGVADNSAIQGLVLSLISFPFLASIINYYFTRGHNKTYKARVVPELVNTVIPGAQYTPKGLIQKKDLKESRLYNFKKGKCCSSEDSITGRIGKTDFLFSEVRITHQEDDGNGSSDTVYDLTGFVFVADFNKYFKGHTVLSSNKKNLDIDTGMFSSLKRCVLEDINFEKLYTTYTTDDQQARYILSPGLQHRIMELNSFFNYREMGISFFDDKMMILLDSNTDHFEVKYNLESVKRDLVALSLLCDIVEQMNLDLRIWSKE